jgi:HD-like signal output (HDOD) protein
MAETPTVDHVAAARVLERDPALVKEVMALVNSLFCRPGSPAPTLESALVRLGLQPVRSLALWLEINRAFPLSDHRAQE